MTAGGERLPIVLSVCGGIEMLAEALRLAGIRPLRYYSIEIDRQAREMANWRFEKFGFGEIRRPCDDLRDFDLSMLGGEIPDMVVAGIPCTSLSLANSRRRGVARLDGASGLIFDFVEKIWKPILAANPAAAVLVENVPSAKEAIDSFARALRLAPVILRGKHFCAQDRDRLFYASFPIAPRPAKICRDLFVDIMQPADCAEVRARKLYDVIVAPARDSDGARRAGVIPTARTLGIIAAAQKGDDKIDDRPLMSASNTVSDGGKTKTMMASAFKVAGLTMATRPDASIHQRVWTDKSPARMAGSGGRIGVLISERIDLAVFSGKSPARMSGMGGRKGAIQIDGAPRKQRDFVLHDGRRVRLPRAVWVIPKCARLPTETETERLFGLRDGATAQPGASRSLRIRLLGNGFIAPVVAHALSRWREPLAKLL